MELTEVKLQTTWNEAAQSLNTNFASIDVEIEKLKNSTTKNKGFYTSFESLVESHPTASDGSMAYVGASSPYSIYLWDSTTNSWIDSGEEFDDSIGGTGNYYTKSEINEKTTAINNELTSLEGRTNSNEGDILNLKGLNDGLGEGQSAYENPIIRLTFNTDNDTSGDDKLNSALDNMFGSSDFSKKYCGRIVSHVDGKNVEAYTFVNSWNNIFTQTVKGCVVLDSNGKISTGATKFRVLSRSVSKTDGVFTPTQWVDVCSTDLNERISLAKATADELQENVGKIKDLGNFTGHALAMSAITDVDLFCNYTIMFFCILSGTSESGRGIVFNVRKNAGNSGVQYLMYDNKFRGRRFSWNNNGAISTSDWERTCIPQITNNTGTNLRLYFRDPVEQNNYSHVTFTSATASQAGLMSADDKVKLDGVKSNSLGSMSMSALNTKLDEMASSAANIETYSGRWTVTVGGNLIEIVQIPAYKASGNVVQYVSGSVGATKVLDTSLTQSSLYGEYTRTISGFTTRSGWMPSGHGGFLKIGTDNATINMRTLSALAMTDGADSAMTCAYSGVLITPAMLDLCIERGWSLSENGGARIEVSRTGDSLNRSCYALTCIFQRYTSSSYPTVFSVCIGEGPTGTTWEIAKESCVLYLNEVQELTSRYYALDSRVLALEQAAASASSGE